MSDATGRLREAALLRLSTAIAAADTERDICKAVAHGLQDAALGFDFVAVLLVDPATGDRVVVASRGYEGAPPVYNSRETAVAQINLGMIARF